MMKMVMFVLDDSELLDDVLEAWQAIGVGGVTILETSGLHRRRRSRPIGARYAFGLGMGAQSVEVGHHTLLAIVPDDKTVQACLEAAERIVGDLNEPNTGVLAAWDLPVVKGVPPALRTQNDDEQ